MLMLLKKLVISEEMMGISYIEKVKCRAILLQ